MAGIPRLTGFLIALTMIGLFTVIFGMYFSNLSVQYGGNNYDADSMAVYNTTGTMHQRAKAYQANISNIQEQSGVLDKIGAFFSSGYDAVLLVTNSFNLFDDVSNQATKELNKAGLGEISWYIKATLSAIVIILIFVGIVVAIIVKKERM